MKLTVVIGNGPNGLEIPLLIFQTKKEAEAYLTDKKIPVGTCFPDSWRKHIPEPQASALFKEGRHYFGCGECYSLSIKEVDTGTPFIKWDLD